MDWIAKMEFYQPAFKAYCRKEKIALGEPGPVSILALCFPFPMDW